MNTEVQTQCGIYIMTGTLDGEPLIKVGKTTVGVERRLTQLNADRYAGIDDWRLHSWFALDNARLTSAVEKILHDEIERFNVPLPNGAGGMATEVFDISAEEAGDALSAALNQMQGYVQLDAQLVGGTDMERPPKRGSVLPQIALIGIILVWFFALSGCTVTSNDVKNNPGRYDEAVLPMSLDEIETALYQYNKLCGHGRVGMIRDPEDPKSAFFVLAFPADRVLNHYEYQETPDGTSTIVRAWSYTSWDESFQWAIKSIQNPDECISVWGAES